MKAIVVTAEGAALADVEVPQPGLDEVLVRVRACALNRADLGMRSGRKHGNLGGPGTVLGMEWAGEVVRTGANVHGFAPGDAVMGSGRGAFAEYAVADHGRVMLLPRAMGFEEAAVVPVALQTMHDAIVTNGGMRAGESVLIQGAASGVGLMGLQIAKALGAGLVIGTSTRAERRARLAQFGADLAFDSRDPQWPAQVREATGGDGVALIVDQLAGPAANQNLAAAALCGRIVNVGRLAGTHADFDFDLHALRRIRYVGVTFRTRTVEEVREINSRMRQDLTGHLAAGRLSLPIERSFALDDAAQALDLMASDAHFGKIVLSLA
jgi:NADPH2:quinone reductase